MNGIEKDKNPLEKDLAAFNEKLPELQGQTGKFAVFFDGKLVGVFDTNLEAFQKAYDVAGLKPFLVRQISSIPAVQHFSRAIKFKCLTLPSPAALLAH